MPQPLAFPFLMLLSMHRLSRSFSDIDLKINIDVSNHSFHRFSKKKIATNQKEKCNCSCLFSLGKKNLEGNPTYRPIKYSTYQPIFFSHFLYYIK